MKDKKEFATCLADKIAESLHKEGSNVFPEVHEVYKNNRMLIGIVFRPEEEGAAPCFYVDEVYKDYIKGRDLDSIAKEIMDGYQQNMSCPVPINEFFTYENVKDKLQLRVYGKAGNEGILKNLISEPFGDDFAKVVYVDQENYSVGCTPSLLEMWGVNADVVFRTAENNFENGGTIFSDMAEVMNCLSKGENFSDDMAIDEDADLFLLTNRSHYYGASVITRSDVLNDVAKRICSNFFVLPSSVHEVLIVPESKHEGYEDLCMMVAGINKYELKPEDKLSDEVQYYDASSGELHNVRSFFRKEMRNEQFN